MVMGDAVQTLMIDHLIKQAISKHIQYGTSDLESGVTPLETGCLYFVYEDEDEEES